MNNNNNNNNIYDVQFQKIKNYNIKNNKKVKDASIKTYLSSIKKICKELFNSDKCSLMYFRDHNSVLDYLNDITNIATRKNIVTAIIIILKANLNNTNDTYIKDIIPIYSDYLKKIAIIQNDKNLDNEKSEKETKNWVTKDEIDDKIKELYKKIGDNLSDKKPSDFKGTKRNFVDNFQMYLVLNLYTLLPPLRNDWSNILIIDSPDPGILDNEFNYINFGTNKLLLNNYKTAKTYGLKIIDIPDPLMKIIKAYEIIKKNTFNNENDNKNENLSPLLINTTNLKPMKKNGLTKYINKIFFPKKVSTTIIRKNYISTKYPVTFSIKEKMKDADIMGHNISMQSSVYSKK